MQIRNTKGFLYCWLPPPFIKWLRTVKGCDIKFEGDFTIWSEAKSQCAGYGSKEILNKVLKASLKVKQGKAEFERDSVIFREEDYTWPLLAGLMWAAAQHNGHLNILDFGGSLGSTYFQNRRFLQSLPAVHWNIIEQPHYVKTGNTHFRDEQLHFYNTISDCMRENEPNMIILSSVLQYLENPKALLNELQQVGASYLMLDRTSFSDAAEDKLVIQRVPATIYSASYPMWIFSMSAFKELLETHWKLHTRFLCPEGHVRSSSGMKFFFEGMLFTARK